MSNHFLYFADPMCSWCWGFSPVIQKIHESFGDQVPIRVVVGGVHPYATQPMTDAEKRYVRGHWEHVHEATGQPFDFSFFDRDGFVYDSEPPCRAIVTSRILDETKTLSLLERIQRAFYAGGQNTVDENVLAELAADVGFDRESFFQSVISDEAKAKTKADFQLAKQSGITGFPSLLGVDGEIAKLLTAGYQSWDGLRETVSHWINVVSTG